MAARGVRFHPAASILGERGSVVVGRGARIGPNVVLDASAGGRVWIGESCWFYRDIELRADKRIAVGSGTTLQRGVSINGNVTIGAKCIFAPNVFVSSGKHIYDLIPELPIRLQEELHASGLLASRQNPGFMLDRPVTIDEDCWIGVNAAIMPGRHLGRGCIVGANSVVTADVPPYQVLAGAPARPIGQRAPWCPPAALDARDVASARYLYDGFALAN
jgi:acetyltransferase-like isoleucine patch superfamily enzyme